MTSDTLREYARQLDLNVDVCSTDTITLSYFMLTRKLQYKLEDIGLSLN